MSSWKCGRKTAVKFCTRANGYRCNEDVHYGESAGGGAESQDTGIDNSLTLMQLTPYEPSIRQAITVFDQTECHGHSSVLWKGRDYDDVKNQLNLGENIRSVMVPEGTDCQVDLYSLENY